MHYTGRYRSFAGEMLLAADDGGVVGVWFENQKYYASGLDKENKPEETPVIRALKRWLDLYFSGKRPDFEPPLHLTGTPFQMEVWTLLRQIPYGSTKTYKEIAGQLAKNRGLERMSAQAVGTAIGKNRISLLVPCHRVVGSNNSLAGYAGGMDKKMAFLKLEGSYRDAYFIPRHSSAP